MQHELTIYMYKYVSKEINTLFATKGQCVANVVNNVIFSVIYI